MAAQDYFRFPFFSFLTPWHVWRGRVTQPVAWLLFFGMPMLGIFSLNVLTQEIVWLGQVYPMRYETMGWIPVVFFVGVLIIAAVTAVFGRLFCGWLCPHNTLSEWTRPIRRWVSIEKKSRWLASLEKRSKAFMILGVFLSLALALLVTSVLSLCLMMYFLPLQTILSLWAAPKTSAIMTVSFGMLMLLSLFLVYAGHHFCRYACPYGMLQGVTAYLTGKFAPMEIRMKAPELREKCGGCTGCQSACPVDLDPREFEQEKPKLGFFEGCFNCGLCVDACSHLQRIKDSDAAGFLSFKLPWAKAS